MKLLLLLLLFQTNTNTNINTIIMVNNTILSFIRGLNKCNPVLKFDDPDKIITVDDIFNESYYVMMQMKKLKSKSKKTSQLLELAIINKSILLKTNIPTSMPNHIVAFNPIDYDGTNLFGTFIEFYYDENEICHIIERIENIVAVQSQMQLECNDAPYIVHIDENTILIMQIPLFLEKN